MIFGKRLLTVGRTGMILACAFSLSMMYSAQSADEDEDEPETPPAATTPAPPVVPPAAAPEVVPQAKAPVPQEPLADLLSMARDLTHRQKYREAKEPYKKALLQTPDDQTVLAEYYEVCVNCKDWSTASATLEKLFALNPAKEKDLYADYAQTLWELRKYDKAKPALKKAIKIGKDKEKSYKTLIKIAIIEKENVLVDEYYQEYFKAVPKEGEMRLEYAKWLQKNGKLKDAIPHYKVASECRPKDDNLHQTLGYILLTEKDYAGAIQEYERAMAANARIAPEMQNSIRYAKQMQKQEQKK